ncbi:hypothetical protein [Paracoccus siganidrum]|uniref:Uncharacterized protein n=1 Tax=Paracoccus siganidrum TaxID=1276757 RepID=A0A419ACB9_9RHOB|nr:hypothetical protein [Paracoccus siganidrum]RJL22182.1 hypothetical protein D3P05_00685 [Paracoccus siganidrum]RMC30442.1 hypothetical protein C9E82_18010 [Paracoccus siganidrum]
MMATSLSKRAIDLLLRAMEARSMSLQTSALHQVSRSATDALIAAKLLVPSGHVPVVAAMGDYEDEPVEATWSAELKSFGYHDSTGRWVKVAHEDIAACRVDYGLALAKLLVAFERAGPSRPTSLVTDLIWEVGTIKLAGAKAPVPVWFARRLGDPGVWTQLEALIGRKPPQEIRIILTSTSGERIPETAQKRSHIINVADVAGDPAKLAISPQVLGARVFPGQVQRRFPIDHSDDYGIVWLRGETLTFGSDKQRQLLGLLFNAYWSGSPECRTAVVLFEAGYGDSTNSFSKVFSGRDDWRSFIKYADGNCWIEP